jgi:hypothetical protein
VAFATDARILRDIAGIPKLCAAALIVLYSFSPIVVGEIRTMSHPHEPMSNRYQAAAVVVVGLLLIIFCGNIVWLERTGCFLMGIGVGWALVRPKE